MILTLANWALKRLYDLRMVIASHAPYVTSNYRLSIFAILISLCTTNAIAKDYPTIEEFKTYAKVGQVYSCLDAKETALIFQIGKITRSANGNPIYHIQLTPLSEGGIPAAHLPFMARGFGNCLPDPEAGQFIKYDRTSFRQGFNQWKKAKGGAFDIPVTDIFDVLRNVVGTNQ